MKRNAKTERFKAYLRKEGELNDNWEAQKVLGYKLLDKPIHYGYNGKWELRADIARRDDADEFISLIERFGITVWCRDKSFTKWDAKQKINVDIKPYFRKIDEGHYNRLLPWCKKLFSYSPGDDRKGWYGVIKYYRINVPEYYFKLKISKHYKTHYKVIDEVLKQEDAEIEAALDTTFYRERRASWKRGLGKGWTQLYNRADRRHNKIALKKNMDYMFEKEDGSWGSWLTDDCDDVVEFKYNHKHSCLWDCW